MFKELWKSIWRTQEIESLVDEVTKQQKERESDRAYYQQQILELRSKLHSKEETIRTLRGVNDALKMQLNEPKEPLIVEKMVFSTKSFDTFCKNFEQPILTNQSPANHGQYLLGIQRVLAYLRAHHVSG